MIDYAALDHFLLFFIAFLSFYLSIYRTLHAVGICGAILLALGIVITDAHFHLADYVLWPDANPQYVTVALCVGAAVTIGIRACMRTRSIDRIFTALAMASVIVTTALFHHVLVATVLPLWARDGGWANSGLLEVNQTEFEAECNEVGLSCFSGPSLQPEQLRPDLRDRIVSIKEHFDGESSDEPMAHAFGHFNDLGEQGVAVVLVYSAPDDIRVIVDEKTGQRIHSTVRDGFYLLSITAHSVWILGALGLIAFHRRRLARRIPR